MRVAESGPTNARPVVHLHGWGASLFSFRHALDRLPRAGCRAIAVDLRGFGLSDKPRADPHLEYRREDFRADLIGLLDRLAIGDGRVSLVGHSLGGGVALDAAIHLSDRIDRLVLINPVGFVFPRSVGLGRFVPRGLVELLGPHAVPRALVEALLRYVAFDDERAITEHVIDQYWLPTQQPGFLGAAHATASQYDWRPVPLAELSRVNNPTLVVVGRRDRLVRGGESAARLIARAEVVTLEGGHCVHEEQPETVWPRIAEFLGRNS